MERVNQIIQHPKYIEYLHRIKKHEVQRVFCKHDMEHFLDVCRIAEILWLQYSLQVCKSKDVDGRNIISNNMREYIYATGLLHDIGRWQEYEDGIRHEVASSVLADPILDDCGFDKEERSIIVMAISNHRNKMIKEEESLSGWIYRADKKSRTCFACEAQEICDWSKDKKNMKLT